jgi:hypothetical protein
MSFNEGILFIYKITVMRKHTFNIHSEALKVCIKP